mmetsp:Transcript_33778/g.93328  ORF Transcript_33778/g.93328 Transcript_33778/m.93328 type:complete len:353 (+) Transcript_33778:643-1701(+)
MSELLLQVPQPLLLRPQFQSQQLLRLGALSLQGLNRGAVTGISRDRLGAHGGQLGERQPQCLLHSLALVALRGSRLPFAAWPGWRSDLEETRRGAIKTDVCAESSELHAGGLEAGVQARDMVNVVGVRDLASSPDELGKLTRDLGELFECRRGRRIHVRPSRHAVIPVVIRAIVQPATESHRPAAARRRRADAVGLQRGARAPVRRVRTEVRLVEADAVLASETAPPQRFVGLGLLAMCRKHGRGGQRPVALVVCRQAAQVVAAPGARLCWLRHLVVGAVLEYLQKVGIPALCWPPAGKPAPHGVLDRPPAPAPAELRAAQPPRVENFDDGLLTPRSRELVGPGRSSATQRT